MDADAAPEPEVMGVPDKDLSIVVDLSPDVPVENKCCPNPLSTLLCTVSCCFGIGLLGAPFGFTQVSEKEEAAILYWGKYAGTVREPGLYWLNPWGREWRRMSTQQRTMNLTKIKVLDAKGNPVVISGVVLYAGTSAKKATIDVDVPWPHLLHSTELREDSFLELQAKAILKQIASRYPYEAPTGTPSLQTEGQEIAAALKKELQNRAAVTGARILSFDIVDLSYAPEVAQAMLVRQQAEALIDARRLIVRAAVDMTSSAMQEIKASGLELNEKTCNEISRNMITVICSHSAATPTVELSGEAR
eukprot:TRINITY_DN47590_c0_g1_i1.p1 TRINITY_DN47590_c0_g1~~TRINITY_DN47590_c0_g1_i1.p1  ORF type:complete len:322 (+),score=56.82 TRINITY_DN47590_c0_g1_i1:57-968(+)